MVKDHKDDIDLFEDAAKNSKDSAFKNLLLKHYRPYTNTWCSERHSKKQALIQFNKLVLLLAAHVIILACPVILYKKLSTYNL